MKNNISSIKFITVFKCKNTASTYSPIHPKLSHSVRKKVLVAMSPCLEHRSQQQIQEQPFLIDRLIPITFEVKNNNNNNNLLLINHPRAKKQVYVCLPVSSEIRDYMTELQSATETLTADIHIINAL